MGQRANYIIKEGSNLTIHYNHWRANSIASDLYLGEKKFLAFVDECQLKDSIIDEPWIEGCVIIDKSSRHLYFWAMEFSKETSVIDYYIKELTKKWNGWQITLFKNKMYEAENVLGIEYINKQELLERDICSKDDVVNDKVEEWETAVVILKDRDHLFVTKTGNLNIETIISYGQEIIPLFKDKENCELPKEDDDVTYECIVIDTSCKKIFINESSFGLWEQCKDLWNGFSLIMGDFGYIEILRLASIETSSLEMRPDRVIEQFNNIVKQIDNFNPFEIAEKLIQEDKDIQFNPDFFDNVKPKKTVLEKVSLGIRKILGRHLVLVLFL
jgi:hypothetical protein